MTSKHLGKDWRDYMEYSTTFSSQKYSCKICGTWTDCDTESKIHFLQESLKEAEKEIRIVEDKIDKLLEEKGTYNPYYIQLQYIREMLLKSAGETP